jgi:hypothetical protein
VAKHRPDGQAAHPRKAAPASTACWDAAEARAGVSASVPRRGRAGRRRPCATRRSSGSPDAVQRRPRSAQAAQKTVRTFGDERTLPRRQEDRPFVLLPRAVLRKGAGPTLRIRVELEPRPAVDAIHAAARQDRPHRLTALVDDLGVSGVQRDAELEDAPAMSGEAAVPEVHAEQVGVLVRKRSEVVEVAAGGAAPVRQGTSTRRASSVAVCPSAASARLRVTMSTGCVIRTQFARLSDSSKCG